MASVRHPALSEDIKLAFNALKRPVWVFDILRRQMHWANDAAVLFWRAADLPELLTRDWAGDMSDSTFERLKANLEAYRRGEETTDRWTFYPAGGAGDPVTVVSYCSGIRMGPDGRLGMLLEASPFGANQLDPETLRLTEAMFHTTVRISLFTLEGELVLQNPASIQTYGSMGCVEKGLGRSTLESRFADRERLQSKLVRLEDDRVVSGEFEVLTQQGRCWHGIQMRRTRDPVTGRVCLLVNETDLTELKAVQRKLVDVARHAGMAEIATGVLHNVGNTVNSIGVSASLALANLQGSSLRLLERVTELLNEHSDDTATLCQFLTEDSSGRRIIPSMSAIVDRLRDEQASMKRELETVQERTARVTTIVASQQAYARAPSVLEDVELAAFLEQAVSLSCAVGTEGIVVERLYADGLPRIKVDARKLMQIMLNLLSNARHALTDNAPDDRRIVLAADCEDGDLAAISVSDNGIGIPPANLARVFAHGFTTKENGHGFGLHDSSNAARELGGLLTAHSDGVGRGATFRLSVPTRPEDDLARRS